MTTATRPAGRSVQFMATCLCDAFFDDAAKASVEVLEHAGCDIEFPEAQTCCGQPAFNGGDWAASRRVVRHTVRVFNGAKPVIVPSGSCAAMMFHGAPLEFEKETDHAEVEALGARTWELADYLVNGLGITTWPGRFPHRVALHKACHTRGTKVIAAIETLLRSIDGLTLVEFGEEGQCCGFGGTFSVTFPHVSGAMGRLKIDQILESKPDFVASPDMSCLMHQKGLADKAGIPFKAIHYAQILRDALNATR